MRIGVVGHSGLVGSEMVKRGYEPINCDVTNQASIIDSIENRIDFLIYCAGYTNVDAAEDNYIDALNVNSWGVHNILNVYRNNFIYISSDHIFSGKKWFSSGYTERHTPDPVNVYGMTKVSGEWLSSMGRGRIGERKSRIIRTSKLFDSEYVMDRLKFDNRFKKTLELTDVLKRSFLHVSHFCDGLEFVLQNWERIPPVLNISGTSIMSHYMFFSETIRHLNLDIDINARKYKLKGATPRPIRAGLNVNLAKKIGVPLYSAWEGIKLL